jgi:hypothetical protein
VNRRSFLRRVITGAIGTAVLSRLPAALVEPVKAYAGLTFQGIPIVFDPYCRPSRVYLINPAYTQYQKVEGWLTQDRFDGIPPPWGSGSVSTAGLPLKSIPSTTSNGSTAPDRRPVERTPT